MNDDLVKRLREFGRWDPDQKEAADRIEELDQLMRINKWKYESCCRDKLAAADRIERLEAALRGVIAIADRDCPEFREARAALEKNND